MAASPAFVRSAALCVSLAGAESTTRKGSAAALDHNKLIHEIWIHALRHQIKLWIERVPSEDNVSDSPSRFDYELLRDLGATWCQPVLANVQLGPERSA